MVTASLAAAPKVIVTEAVPLMALGLEISAVRLRAPTRPVSLTPLPVKLATPAFEVIETVPPMVASVDDKVTV